MIRKRNNRHDVEISFLLSLNSVHPERLKGVLEIIGRSFGERTCTKLSHPR